MKIPTVFKRDEYTFRVTPQLNPDCTWVVDGQGIMSIKIDGINVKIIQGKDFVYQLWRRIKVPETGEYIYIRCDRQATTDQYLYEAFDNLDIKSEGIYEAYGPKINGNPQKSAKHFMIKTMPADGIIVVGKNSTTIKRGPTVTTREFYDSLRYELEMSPEIEGLVFHLEESGMKVIKSAKIKRKDFGFQWPPT